MASSRDWVCIRLTTYEDSAEFDWLEALFNGGLGGLESIFELRSGQLENTTFGLLAPDGATRLSCIGRDPHFVLDTIRVHGECGGGSGALPQRLANVLRSVAGRFEPRATVAALPRGPGLRRGLNAAACDDQPLVVVCGPPGASRRELERRLARRAWSEDFVGRLQYVVIDAPQAPVTAPGVYGLEPGTFGLGARVLATAELEASDGELGRLLNDTLEVYARVVLPRSEHVAEGRRRGAGWACPFPPRALR